MAVTLRLARHGQKNRPFYRIVATESGAKRDGRFIEKIGFYNPLVNPPIVSLKEERVRAWVKNGASASTLVRKLVTEKIPGLFEAREKNQLEKKLAARRKRKDRAKARAK